MSKLKVICVSYERPREIQVLITSFLAQTNPNWELHIIHDGPSSKEVRQAVAKFIEDTRIIFYESEERKQLWGHPNRKALLDTFSSTDLDYVLMTNDDNYYIPIFVDKFLKETSKRVGIVYCFTLHSMCDYTIHPSELKYCKIDMGAFIVRLDVAKTVGFNSFDFAADGIYAEACAARCNKIGLRLVRIPYTYFVHN